MALLRLNRWKLWLIALLISVGLSSCDDFFGNSATLCETDTYIVDSFEEEEDPNRMCLAGMPCTLQAAIRSANYCRGGDPKTIQLESGTYTLTHPSPVGGADPVMDASENERVGWAGLPRHFGTLTIEGNGATITRSSDAEYFRIIHVPPGSSLTINNLTISGGTTTRGAGIYNDGNLEISGVSIKSNRGIKGAGIYNTGELIVSGSSINSNSGFHELFTHVEGIGIYNAANATAKIDGIEIARNSFSSSFITILFNGSRARMEINNAVLTSNDSGAGSPILNAGGTILIDSSTFFQNRGDKSGVLYQLDGEAIIQRSTFSMNFQRGATILCATTHSSLTLEDVTIYQNQGVEFTGALKVSDSCHAIISNTLVAENTPKDCFFDPSRLEINGANFGSDHSCADFSILGGDPLLGPLQDNGGPTWTLLPGRGSPVIDSGSACLEADQRGETRPARICDIGAVERQPHDE